MTSDIVEQLRAWAEPISSGYEVPRAAVTLYEAADEIERLTAENEALRKDADATRRRQLYELAGYLSVELPELHGVLGGRLVNVVDAYRAKIGDGIRPEELT
jgi:hypothetical protein